MLEAPFRCRYQDFSRIRIGDSSGPLDRYHCSYGASPVDSLLHGVRWGSLSGLMVDDVDVVVLGPIGSAGSPHLCKYG